MTCMKPLKDQSTFIVEATNKHQNKYTYNNTTYVNDKTKILITCPIHGDFLQTPRAHLSGKGCMACYLANKAHDTDSFIQKANGVHFGYYDYSKVKYVNAKTKITIICPEHGEFQQTPNDHLVGKGCRRCGLNRLNGAYNDTFFKKFPNMCDKPALLYCIKITNTISNEQFWKVGITTLASVQRRYGAIRNHTYEVLQLVHLSLLDAYHKEQQLLNENIQHKYTPNALRGGHTECFSKQIML